jgi:hypothetical protein
MKLLISDSENNEVIKNGNLLTNKNNGNSINDKKNTKSTSSLLVTSLDKNKE